MSLALGCRSQQSWEPLLPPGASPRRTAVSPPRLSPSPGAAGTGGAPGGGSGPSPPSEPALFLRRSREKRRVNVPGGGRGGGSRVSPRVSPMSSSGWNCISSFASLQDTGVTRNHPKTWWSPQTSPWAPGVTPQHPPKMSGTPPAARTGFGGVPGWAMGSLGGVLGSLGGGK